MIKSQLLALKFYFIKHLDMFMIDSFIFKGFHGYFKMLFLLENFIFFCAYSTEVP